jgi:hypothetical protein
MGRLLAILVTALLLNGCELFKPVTAEEAKAVAGQYLHRTDIGGYYQYDNGARVLNPPEWH